MTMKFIATDPAKLDAATKDVMFQRLQQYELEYMNAQRQIAEFGGERDRLAAYITDDMSPEAKAQVEMQRMSLAFEISKLSAQLEAVESTHTRLSEIYGSDTPYTDLSIIADGAASDAKEDLKAAPINSGPLEVMAIEEVAP